MNPAEGDEITLECTVDANPPAHSVVWSGPNDFAHEGLIFKIDSVQRFVFSFYLEKTCLDETWKVISDRK